VFYKLLMYKVPTTENVNENAAMMIGRGGSRVRSARGGLDDDVSLPCL